MSEQSSNAQEAHKQLNQLYEYGMEKGLDLCNKQAVALWLGNDQNQLFLKETVNFHYTGHFKFILP